MAVHTHITPEALKAFMEPYDLGAVVGFKDIAEGVENSNFHVFTSRTRAILTIFEKRTNPSDLPFFMSFMAHLAAQGIPCPNPLPQKDGNIVTRLRGKPAVLLQFMPGESADPITPDHARAAGQMLARMHLAAADFAQTRVNTMGLTAWEKLILSCLETGAASFGEKVTRLKDELAFLKTHWPDSLPRGVVHADFFPDNVFFDRLGNVSGVLDFYFSCAEILAYDFMIACNAWCFDKSGAHLSSHADAFLHGYECLRPMSAAEKKALPLLGRAAAVRIIATRLYDWFHTPETSVITRKSPEPYLKILEFHREKS